MKRLFYILLMAVLMANCSAADTKAQPKLTQRALKSYPTALPMDNDNIEWQQDVYREINISNDDNAGLFCYDANDETQEDLFAIIFRLALEGKLPLYKYNLEGNEVYNRRSRVSVKDVMDDYHIFYKELGNGKMEVKEDDIPSSEVTCYYLKEGVYYDLSNSSFRRRVLALCPVIVSMDDEFGEEETKYPLFWVKYADLEKHLKGKRIIPNSRNKAAIMNISDFFTLNLYSGPIYKVYNAQGISLSQYCENDSLIKVEQQRIGENLHKVQRNTYNTYKEVKAPAPAEKKKKPRKRIRIFGLSIGRDDKQSEISE